MGCSAFAASGADRPETVRELLGSEKNLALIREATAARACSVEPTAATASLKGSRKIPDVSHPKERGPYLQLPAADVALLRATLLDDRSYEWVVSSFCVPTYTIRAEFQARGGTVAANFCFGCHQVFFSRDEKPL